MLSAVKGTGRDDAISSKLSSSRLASWAFKAGEIFVPIARGCDLRDDLCPVMVDEFRCSTDRGAKIPPGRVPFSPPTGSNLPNDDIELEGLIVKSECWIRIGVYSLDSRYSEADGPVNGSVTPSEEGG